jgi:hypothetical protein
MIAVLKQDARTKERRRVQCLVCSPALLQNDLDMATNGSFSALAPATAAAAAGDERGYGSSGGHQVGRVGGWVGHRSWHLLLMTRC